MPQRGGRARRFRIGRRDARQAAQDAQLEVTRPTDDLSGKGFLVFRLTTFLREVVTKGGSRILSA
jgi:hypothetical protein